VGPGVAGAPQWALHAGVLADQAYYYAAFVGDGTGVWSTAAQVKAFWPSVAPGVAWAFSTGVSALGTTRVMPGEAYYSVTNDGILHSLVSGTGTSAGEWRSGWTPFGTNGASQHRPVVLRLETFTIGGASGVAFVASQDGHVYAVNADTGAQLWRTEKLAEAFQAAPSVVLQEQGARYDLVIVATRNTVGRNEIVALRPADGSVAWTFDNGGGAGAFGIVSAKPTIDVARDRIYFTTRRNAAGTSDTLWCLGFTADAATYLWSDDGPGDVDSAAIVSGSTVYVGGNDGVVHAYGVDGGFDWSRDTGSGQPVKGFVQPYQGNLYFSTGDEVHALTQSGEPVAGWATNPVGIAGASPPLVTPTRIYVGGAASRLYAIDIGTGAISSSVEIGDPSQPKAVGSPTMDNRAGQIVVGAEDGALYLVPAF
jgi:outer membrane protein assembly factor BamB